MFVMTVDQEGSTRLGDQVEGLLAALADVQPALAGVVRPFERTVGDEVQAVLDDARSVVTLTLDLVRRGGWTVGIGAGPVDEPLPASSRAASGPAFVHARAAVERAKGRGSAVPVAVEAGTAGAPSAAEAEAVLRLLGGVVARRTDAGWEVVDRLGTADVRQKDVAAELGISEQAVSQRLRTALWAEELAVRPVAARLLMEGDR